MTYYVKNIVLPEGDGYRLALAETYQVNGESAYRRSMGWKAEFDKEPSEHNRMQQYFASLESWMNYEIARQYMRMTDSDHDQG